MSHITEISVEIKDLDSLEAACKEMGLELVRGQARYKWFGRFVGGAPMPAGMTEAEMGRCNHAIRIPGNAQAYEIGVCQQGGNFVLRWDSWQGGYGMQDIVGKDAGKLSQAYAVQVASKQARRQGMSVVQTRLADGRVQLRCR